MIVIPGTKLSLESAALEAPITCKFVPAREQKRTS